MRFLIFLFILIFTSSGHTKPKDKRHQAFMKKCLPDLETKSPNMASEIFTESLPLIMLAVFGGEKALGSNYRAILQKIPKKIKRDMKKTSFCKREFKVFNAKFNKEIEKSIKELKKQERARKAKERKRRLKAKRKKDREIKKARKWVKTEKINPIDDSKTISLMVMDQNYDPFKILPDYTALTLRCTGETSKLELYIGSSKYIGKRNILSKEDPKATIRFGKEVAEDLEMSEASGGTGLFFKDPEEIFKRMLEYKKMAVRYYPYSSASVTAIFNIEGLSKFKNELDKHCSTYWKYGEESKDEEDVFLTDTSNEPSNSSETEEVEEEDQDLEVIDESVDWKKRYIGIEFGAINPFQINGVRDSTSLMGSFGFKPSERTSFEGAISYSKWKFGHTSSITGDLVQEMNAMVSARLTIPFGMFEPHVGVIANYAYRKHNQSRPDQFETGAFGFGASVGLYIFLLERVKLGLESRYLLDVRKIGSEPTSAEHGTSHYRMFTLSSKIMF